MNNKFKDNEKEKDLFKLFSSNVKLIEVKNDIENDKYKDIDWFNLESEISNLFENLESDEIEYITYFFEKEFIKINKKLLNGYDKDRVASSVFKDMSDNHTTEISRTELVKKDYFIESNSVSAVDKVLRIFEFYGVVSKYKQKDNNRSFYQLDLKRWFKKSKYHIQDYNLISKLAPIITSYINIGFIKTHSIENLFHKISEVIEFAICPSVYHNQMKEIEETFLIAIEDKDTLDIKFKKNNEDIQMNIIPEKIIYKSNEKYLLAKDTETNKNIELSLFDLRFSISIENTTFDYSQIPKTSSMLSVDKNLTTSEGKQETEVILECDSIVYEYFKMKPLSNMLTYDEQNKLIEFMETYNQKVNDNKFYIVASDTEDKIISTVLHTLNNVKILEPSHLNDKLASMFKSYLDKTNIDICPKPSKPNNDNKQSENFSNSNDEDIKKATKKEVNTDNIDINKIGTDFYLNH